MFLQQKMIEIFCNISLKEVLNIKHSSIIKIISHLNKLFEQKPKFKTTFKRGDLKFGFIPQLDDITFGEYVDLDSTLTDWETMDKAMGVLYRPITLEQSHKYIIEKYKTYDKYEMKILWIWNYFRFASFFLEFKQRINESYTELFESGDEQPDLSAKANFSKRWNWYSSIYRLSNSNITKIDEVTKLPLHQCLMFLAFEKDKNETETKMIKSKIR